MTAVRERPWPNDVAVSAAVSAASASAAAGLPRQRDARPSDVPRTSFRTMMMMMIASDRNCYWRSLVAADARRLACC